MLRGLSPLLSPDLLACLYRMGHGDELILADAHFPGERLGVPVIRADGLAIAALLEAVLPLFALDQYVEQPLAMMAAVPGDELDPAVEDDYRAALTRLSTRFPELGDVSIERVERFAFYERARQAFCVVMTGDVRKYGNLILKKGVTPLG